MTTFDDLAEDVFGAVQALSTDPRFSRVVVLGHGEGGWLAIRAAVRGAPAAGIALLATPGRPFVEVLRHQLARTADSLRLVQFDSAMARYLRGEPQAGLPLYLELLLRPANRRFMESLVSYSAVSELRRVDVLVLVAQGDRDSQVALADAELLRAAAPRGELVVLAGANHLFKTADLAGRVGELALEADPRVPIVKELVERIAAWVYALSTAPFR
jgi:pimeloyl-ACP methyl ester carboxylesterase